MVAGPIIGVAGLWVVHSFIQSAVRKGVAKALRDHHQWLHPEDDG